MIRRLALGFLFAGSTLMLAAFLTGGKLAAGVFAVVAVLFPVGLILLSAPRPGRLLLGGLLILALILLVSTVGVLILTPDPGRAPSTGLPPVSWLMLIGIGVLPMLLVVWIFAATFPRTGR